VIRKNSLATRVYTMPSLPPGAARTLLLLQHGRVDPCRLARVVEDDPAWAAEILKQARSPLWSLSAAPADVEEAVGLLGLRRFHQLVAVAAVGPLLRAPIPGYGLAAGELWNHSVAVAVATQELLREKGLKPCEEAFTAAILHDVGKLVLGSVLESDGELSALAAGGDPLAAEEAERLAAGIDHSEAGAALLDHWKLPYWLVTAVGSHHDPMASGFLIADLVHLADALVEERVSPEAGERWSLPPRTLPRILGRTLARLIGVRVSTLAGEGR
jgi:putative nucleotidyltransferase with HDIG domain